MARFFGVKSSLGVSADDQKKGKHDHGFSDIQPPGSPRKFGNHIRSCHDFSLTNFCEDAGLFVISRSHAVSKRCTSNPSKQHKDDDNDQDGADDSDTAVSITVTVAAEPATETTKQKNNEDNYENESK
jgi:hypothetical protein